MQQLVYGEEKIIDSLRQQLQKTSIDSLRTEIHFLLAENYLNIDVDSTFEHCQKIILSSDFNNPTIQVAKAYNLQAIAMLTKGHYRKSIFYANKALKNVSSLLQKAPENPAYRLASLRFHNTLANSYYYLSDYASSIENYQYALHIARTIKDEYRTSLLYNNIGALYQEWGDNELAMKYLQEGLSFAKKIDNQESIASAYVNIGNTFNANEEYDSAFYYYHKSIPLIEKMDEPLTLCNVYINLIPIYLNRFQLRKAEQLLQKVQPIIEENGYLRYAIFFHTIYGDLEKAKGNFDAEISHFSEAFKIAQKLDEKKTLLDLSYQLHTKYARQKEYQKAYEYSLLMQQLDDSIYSENTTRKINELEVKFDVERKELQIRSLKKAREYDRKLRYLSFFIVLIIILSTSLIIRTYIVKRKKQKALFQVELKLREQAQTLAETKLQKQELEQAKLRDDIDFKAKQLTVHALNMMQKNKMLQELLKSIQEVSKQKDNTNLSKELSRLKLQIKRSINVDKDWDLFKLYFEQVNRNFFEKLKEINPELNQNDFRLAALIKLKLNIKESASVLNLSPLSIKGSRHRLRKKLHLESRDDLMEFIGRI
jgi:tetratricopeptide (TPR) repeat protein